MESPIQYYDKDQLRILSCGSVDDGKSTLLGRLLYDIGKIPKDQMAKIEKLSKKHGTVEGKLDPALLLDGLKSEIEQGITIDVAYRYFSTNKRSFILADAPGHVQYTRNMATGASHADLAILLVDAKKGISEQTRRHSFICSLFGIKYIIVAINKMDLIDWDEATYLRIKQDFLNISSKTNFYEILFVPTSAVNGDNVTSLSKKSTWYDGKPLLEILETIYINKETNNIDGRLPIQSSIRLSSNFRGYCGRIASGKFSIGDEIIAFPSMKRNKIKRIHSPQGIIKTASQYMSVIVELNDELDVSRGNMFFPINNSPIISNTIDCYLLWASDEFGKQNKTYLLKTTTNTVDCYIKDIQYLINMNSLSREKEHVTVMEANDIGRCTIMTSENIAYDPFDTNKTTGSFILIDKITNNTVACGMITGKQRTTNIINNANVDTSNIKEHILKQKGCTIWLTGLSGSGKTTIANILDKKLAEVEKIACIVDGDTIRSGLNKDLGFSNDDRLENIRRIAETCKLMNNNGIITIVSTISPTKVIRQQAVDIIGKDNFLECYVEATIKTCIDRDPKGLYSKKIEGFTGISSEYEPPKNPILILNTEKHSQNDLADMIFELLKSKNYIF